MMALASPSTAVALRRGGGGVGAPDTEARLWRWLAVLAALPTDEDDVAVYCALFAALTALTLLATLGSRARGLGGVGAWTGVGDGLCCRSVLPVVDLSSFCGLTAVPYLSAFNGSVVFVILSAGGLGLGLDAGFCSALGLGGGFGFCFAWETGLGACFVVLVFGTCSGPPAAPNSPFLGLTDRGGVNASSAVVFAAAPSTFVAKLFAICGPFGFLGLGLGAGFLVDSSNMDMSEDVGGTADVSGSVVDVSARLLAE